MALINKKVRDCAPSARATTAAYFAWSTKKIEALIKVGRFTFLRDPETW